MFKFLLLEAAEPVEHHRLYHQVVHMWGLMSAVVAAVVKYHITRQQVRSFLVRTQSRLALVEQAR